MSCKSIKYTARSVSKSVGENLLQCEELLEVGSLKSEAFSEIPQCDGNITLTPDNENGNRSETFSADIGSEAQPVSNEEKGPVNTLPTIAVANLRSLR